jgi:hypothetical protein
MRNLPSDALLISVLLLATAGRAAEPDAIWCTVREAGKPAETAARIAVPSAEPVSQADMTVAVSSRDLPGGRRHDLAVTDTSGTEREILVEWHVAAPDSFTDLFITDGNGARELASSGSAAYRSTLALPAITVYDAARGLTLAAAFDVPAPDLTFAWTRAAAGTEIVATVRHLRLPAGGTAQAALLLGRHAGCWRPGLGWLVACHPEYFQPPNPRVFTVDGPMIYDFVTSAERLQRDLGQGLVWQELGWYWPHLGLYRPDADSWRRQPGTEGGLGAGGEVTVALLNDYIHRARALGVEQFLYFQSTESWAEYAEQRFPESRVTNAAGALAPTWIKCVVMNPDPDGPFGRHILDQLRRLLETFPEMAGVFWDQNCYTFFDYAHDDGISLLGGRRVSQLEFAQERLLARAAKLLHDQNKVIMTNGGWTAALARYCDGHMSEGSGPTRRLQYICMRKHLTLLSYDSTPAAAREKLLLALETGAQPAVTLGNDACRAQFAGYRPIFAQLQRREWVFEPRALVLPAGIRGNVFRNAAGNAVVTAVADERYRPSPAESLQPAAIRLRLSDDANVAAVLEWRADLAGYRALPSRPEGPERRVEMARPDPCAALILVRQGRWLAADTPRLVAGQAQPVTISLLNLTPEPWQGEWEIRGGEHATKTSLQVAPMAVQSVALGNVAGPTDAATVTVTIRGPQPDGSTGETRIDLPVVAPVTLAFPTPEPASVIARDEVPFAVANRSSQPLTLDLTLSWSGTPAPARKLSLAPGEVQSLSLRADPPKGGLVELLAELRGAGTSTRRTVRMDVIDTTLPPSFRAEDVESLALTLEVFNSLGEQWAAKPVTVNAIPAGPLPVTGQTLQWHPGMKLDVAGDAAREMVRCGLKPDGSLELVVSVGNEVKNCFKVTNVQASLRTRAGVAHQSSAMRQVVCSAPGWLYSEGQTVPLGAPVPLGTLRFLPAR